MSKHKKGFFRKYILRYWLHSLLVLAGLSSCTIALVKILQTVVAKYSNTRWALELVGDQRDDDSSSAVLEILHSNHYGTHKYVQLKNVRLHYVENGDRSKPLMIFVHSFREFWLFWRDQLVHYGRNFWTVAVDLRGYGNSEKSAELSSYKLKSLTKDLKRLIEVLIPADENRKVILIGHGWGGIIVHNFVRKHSDIVERYVTFGAVPSDCFNLNAKQLTKLWSIYFSHLPLLSEFYFSSLDMNLFFTDDFLNDRDPAITEAYKYTFSRPGVMTCVLNHYRANAWRIALSAIYKFPTVENPSGYPTGLLIRSVKANSIDESSYEKAGKIPNLTIVKVDDYSYRYLLSKRWSQFHNLVDKFLIKEDYCESRREYPLMGDIR